MVMEDAGVNGEPPPLTHRGTGQSLVAPGQKPTPVYRTRLCAHAGPDLAQSGCLNLKQSWI